VEGSGCGLLSDNIPVSARRKWKHPGRNSISTNGFRAETSTRILVTPKQGRCRSINYNVQSHLSCTFWSRSQVDYLSANSLAKAETTISRGTSQPWFKLWPCFRATFYISCIIIYFIQVCNCVHSSRFRLIPWRPAGPSTGGHTLQAFVLPTRVAVLIRVERKRSLPTVKACRLVGKVLLFSFFDIRCWCTVQYLHVHQCLHARHSSACVLGLLKLLKGKPHDTICTHNYLTH
jgi:hypothetical protein